MAYALSIKGEENVVVVMTLIMVSILDLKLLDALRPLYLTGVNLQSL